MKNGVLQVAQQSFYCCPVNLHGMMHKLGEFIDSKADIRSCKGQVLQSTNNFTVFGEVNKGGTIIQL
jgi:hypothetical protein